MNATFWIETVEYTIEVPSSSRATRRWSSRAYGARRNPYRISW